MALMTLVRAVRRLFLRALKIVTESVHACRAKLVTCWRNERTLGEALADAFINVVLILTWVLITFLSEMIPTRYRPSISTRVDMRLDEYMFGTTLGRSMSILNLLLGALLLYLKLGGGRGFQVVNFTAQEGNERVSVLEAKEVVELSGGPHFEDDPPCHDTDPNTIKGGSLKVNSWAPACLCIFAYFFVCMANYFTISTNFAKFITSWIAYVVLLWLVPLAVCLWLYLFHPPGSVRLYLTALGMHNIAVVLMHIFFPTAPPLYLHDYGEYLNATYSMTYTTGIIRQRLPYFITDLLHMVNPKYFSSFPSLHATVASLSFLFLLYYSASHVLKLLAAGLLLFQWWAILYLKQNFRADVLFGALVSIATFTYLEYSPNGFRKVHYDFVRSRSQNDFIKGSSMGMRLNSRNKLVDFFDPLVH